MSGIQQMWFTGAAVSNAITLNWPPDGTAALTTVYGTHAIYAGSPPPAAGSLGVTNTDGTDSAHTYVTALSSAIKTSVQSALSAATVGSPQLQGMFSRGNLQATPKVLHDGYRFDYTNPLLRLIRFDAGVTTTLATVSLTTFSPTYDYYLTVGLTNVTLHMTDLGSGNAISGWLSAPGHPDTPMVTDSAGTGSYTTGRIGFLSFFNAAGVGGPDYWTNYAATWTI